MRDIHYSSLATRMLWMSLFAFHMDKEKIRYFVYARKSTESDGRQVLSIDGQLQDNQKIIQQHNLMVVDTITDEASASVPFNRPGYSAMVKRIKKGEAAGIVVWNVDRLLRNPLEEGEFKWLMQTGVIKSIWTPYREYRGEDNGLLFSIEASMATQYSRDLAVKVRRGLLQKCDLGLFPGFAPLGYLNTKFAAHGTNSIIEDPERWHIVRKGFDLLLSRKYNTPEIAEILRNEYGLRSRPAGKKSGVPLNKSVLYNIFTNPFYSGSFYYNGKLYKGNHKPMVTVEEFDTVQEILGRKFKDKPQKHEFAFTGLIKCGICNCAITASAKTKQVKTTGEYKTYVFYHCTKRKGNCTDKHYTKVDEIESMIEKELMAYHLMPEFRDWAVRIVLENHQNEIDKQSILLKELMQREQKMLQELDALIDMRVSNYITEEKYLQKKIEKEAQASRVKEKIDQIQKGTYDWLSQFKEKLDFAVNAIERFKTRIPQEQKQVCFTFGWNWTLKRNKLIIDKLEWFEAVKGFEKAVEHHFGRLEPQKVFDRYGENASFEILRPLVRRLLDDVRTRDP